MIAFRSLLLIVAAAYAGCAGNERVTAPPTNVTVDAPAPGIVPVVEVISQAEWDACETCDGQSLEGDNAPLRFEHFPAVTHDGALIAVTEERDGWGHIPIPGVRILDRSGKTVTWLPLAGNRVAIAPALKAANAELAKHSWMPIEQLTRQSNDEAEENADYDVKIGTLSMHYRQHNDGNMWLPPSEIRVTDPAGHILVERRDTERAWAHANACNMPRFELVGGNEKAGVVLFTTTLGMGGHNCDGVEQRPGWHVLAFRAR